MTDLVAQLVGALGKFVERFKDHEDAGPRGETWQSSEFLADLAEARAALSAAKDGGWLPIETAPKAGSFLAVLECGGEQTICTMRHSVAASKNSRPDGDFVRERVTHWQPLPNPPKEQA